MLLLELWRKSLLPRLVRGVSLLGICVRQGGWMARARFMGVWPADSQGPVLWYSQHCHLEILNKLWTRHPTFAQGPANFICVTVYRVRSHIHLGSSSDILLLLTASISLFVKLICHLLKLDVSAKCTCPVPRGPERWWYTCSVKFLPPIWSTNS